MEAGVISEAAGLQLLLLSGLKGNADVEKLPS